MKLRTTLKMKQQVSPSIPAFYPCPIQSMRQISNTRASKLKASSLPLRNLLNLPFHPPHLICIPVQSLITSRQIIINQNLHCILALFRLSLSLQLAFSLLSLLLPLSTLLLIRPCLNGFSSQSSCPYTYFLAAPAEAQALSWTAFRGWSVEASVSLPLPNRQCAVVGDDAFDNFVDGRENGTRVLPE